MVSVKHFILYLIPPARQNNQQKITISEHKTYCWPDSDTFLWSSAFCAALEIRGFTLFRDHMYLGIFYLEDLLYSSEIFACQFRQKCKI